MSDTQEQTPGEHLPEPQVTRRSRWRLPLIWLVPVVAAAIGFSLVLHAYLSEGPVISIGFKTAEGIVPGKTQVKFKNVVIGRVSSVNLGRDRSTVMVRVDLEKRYAYFASSGSRFWVVRPRIGLGGVSGLSTLFSGAYIGADTGSAGKRHEQKRFHGLETPPPLTHGEPGRSFIVDSDDLGSLDIGSPVYFRRIQVGRVVGYKLDKDGGGVKLQVFIDAPYDRYVTQDSRFWNASGVSVSVTTNGVKVHTESLASVVSGGMAFQAPPLDPKAPRAPANARFRLYNTRAKAMRPPDGPPLRIHMRFSQSVYGLAVGAPVDFEGITIGQVKNIGVSYDPKLKRFPVNVTAVVYPQRLGRANANFARRMGDPHMKHPGLGLAFLVRHGLRAQLRSASLLTNQLYISLDFFPNDRLRHINAYRDTLRVPTVPGDFDKLQEQLAHIASRLDKVPFDRIGQHLNQTLVDLDQSLKQFNGNLAPKAGKAMVQAQEALKSLGATLSGDSPLQENLGQTLDQIRRAARSIRVLTDYLSQHPDALLRGKRNNQATPEPAPAHRPTGVKP